MQACVLCRGAGRDPERDAELDSVLERLRLATTAHGAG